MPQNSRDDPNEKRGAAWQQAAWPAAFSTAGRGGARELYLGEPAARKLAEFFEGKGLRELKKEDQREQWYEDFLGFQSKHNLYASVLSPQKLSSTGRQFDLLRYARFLEVFGYFSPGHAYSLQVTFLGLFSILMGDNDSLKKEAVAALETGGQLAFGVSEREHGSDLFANEFTVRPTGGGKLIANGSKYYIGNANCAAIISMLGRKIGKDSAGRIEKRDPFVLFALRPAASKGFGNVRKIRTLGVRASFVGAFEVKDHELAESDIVTEGRGAWEAVLGTVTLGKFFLGFGSIGICEHALQEAVAHMKRRILYGRPVIEMPHIRLIAAQAWARLTAMKLYAYRALDYAQAAGPADRRYLLYCAVQKARTSTEGVKVMSLLSECVGAKGFEADDTYFEMALRDAQLIPLLESSAHINLGLASQFIGRYFGNPDPNLAEPGSLAAGEVPAAENSFLMEAPTGAVNAIAFPAWDIAYKPLVDVANVGVFAAQANSLREFVTAKSRPDLGAQFTLALGQCIGTIAYGQLIAENAVRLGAAGEMISVIFGLLIADLSALALGLASSPGLDDGGRDLLRRAVSVSKTSAGDWDFVADRMGGA